MYVVYKDFGSINDFLVDISYNFFSCNIGMFRGKKRGTKIYFTLTEEQL